MKVPKITSLIIVITAFFSSCYYDVEEVLYPTIGCATEDMSYVNDILPIIDSKCYACHSTAANFGNVALEGYETIINYVDNGSLIGVIRHEAGFSAMPKNGSKLLDCEIEKIKAWIDNDAPNN